MTSFTLNMPRSLKGMMAKLPMMIDCQEFEQFLIEYLDGGLSSRERFVFETHLRFCRECREYLRACKAARTLAREVGAIERETAVDIPEDLVVAVIEALRQREV